MPPERIAQIGLRVTETLRQHLEKEAENGSRSINAEVVRRLESSVQADVRIRELTERIAALEAAAKEDGATIRTLSRALAAVTPEAVRAGVSELFRDALKRSWGIKPGDKMETLPSGFNFSFPHIPEEKASSAPADEPQDIPKKDDPK